MRIRSLVPATVAAAVLAALLAGCVPTVIFDRVAPKVDSASQDSRAGTPAQLIRVIDGDTIAVVPTEQLPATNDSGTEHVVRVLSVDAPEMNKMSEEPAECGAEAATEHLAALLGEGTELSLVFDAVSDHTDRYGRSLAYVELPGQAQVIDVGAAMVRDGFAEAWYPNSEPAPERFDSYSQLQRAAASAGAGSHATCDTIGR